MTKSAQDRRVHTRSDPWRPSVIADLDTLLIALYVELTDRIIPARAARVPCSARAAQPPSPMPSWSVWRWRKCCCASTTNTTGCARRRPGSGTCFPGCCRSPNTTGACAVPLTCWRVRLRWLADQTPATTELLRLVDGTPVPCGAARGPPRGGRTCSATPAMAATPPTTASTGVPTCCWWSPARAPPPGLAWPTPNWPVSVDALLGLLDIPANRPVQGTVLVSDKGLAGHQVEIALGRQAADPAAARPQGRARPGWLPCLATPAYRGDHLDAEEPTRPGTPRRARAPGGLWTRIVQRLLALNAVDLGQPDHLGVPGQAFLDCSYDHF